MFAIIYCVRWLKSIASVYEPGASLELFSQDISVESLNNISRGEVELYASGFRSALDWLGRWLPRNVTLGLRRHRDAYDAPSAYHQELMEAKAAILKENDGRLPLLSVAQRSAIELNVRLRPGQDEDFHWREKVELEHQAIFRTRTLMAYATRPDFVAVNAGRFPGVIAIGSTKCSTAKFWAGVGALQEDENGGWKERVLTPKQVGSVGFVWEPVQLNGLVGRNFSRIRILQSELDGLAGCDRERGRGRSWPAPAGGTASEPVPERAPTPHRGGSASSRPKGSGSAGGGSASGVAGGRGDDG